MTAVANAAQNAPAVEPAQDPAGQTHIDVLIVGAGVSGIGAAHHLQQQCPGKNFLILEAKDQHGGTWYTHTYPGIRSDSDLYTFGYKFKPWTGVPIAEAKPILDYMGEVIEDDGLDQFIRYNQKVISASWDSAASLWTVQVVQTDSDTPITYTCNFLYMCQGYYDHDNPYTPDWEGMDDFKGQIVHPQLWPEDMDYKGKRVVVIGSGATAATIIPAMAADCEHITMLQRSPTYFWTGENRNELADRLRGLDVPEEWVHEIVRRDLLSMAQMVQDLAKAEPELVKEELFKVMREALGDEMVKEHFTPKYRPWQQRLAYVPDGDLFEGLKSGKASVVTDHIDRFTEKGILLKSGEELEADIIITATGFNLLFLGGIDFEVDGEKVNFPDTVTYRGLMISGVPNMVHVFGYLRTSWTMRVDMIGEYVCRLLNYMDARGAKAVVAELSDEEQAMERKPWIEDDEFNSGYLKRGRDQFPKNGDREPWCYQPDYYKEKDMMPNYAMDDPALHYTIKQKLAAL